MCLVKNDKRVTAVLGAGINLEYFEWSDKTPTTANITRSVVNTSEYVYDDGSKGVIPGLIKEVYLHLCATNSPKALKPSPSYGEMHFEKIFHVLEMLDSYDKLWTRGYKNSSVPIFAYFAGPAFRYNPDEIHDALYKTITLIMDFVNDYNEYFLQHKEDTCRWYTDFWRDAKFRWDIFNFNYDTTIENSLTQYEDGFEDVINHPNLHRFNPNKLLQSTDSTINHIHGCIQYGYGDFSAEEENRENIYKYDFHDWYKWDTYALNKKHWIGRGASSIISQSGDSIFPSPIITGLNKADKILILPFSTYRLNLSQCLAQNPALLIAGYSFGDYYVNYELERMHLYHGDKLRVVLIDYWYMSEYKDMTVSDMIHAYIEFQEADSIPPRKAHFLSKIMQSGNLDYHRDHFNTLTYDNYLISENKQLMLFVGGWRKALQYKDEIYRFLQS